MLVSKYRLWAGLMAVVFSGHLHAQGVSTVPVPEHTAASSRPYQLSGDWNFDLGGGNTQEGKDTWSAAYLYFASNFNFKFSEDLRVKISPWARMYTGRAQERWDDDSLASRINLHEFYLSYQPLSFFELRGGGHAQSVVGSPMLVSNLRTFPGFQEILKAKAGNVDGRIVFQQVVPTSYSLNDEREKQEALPWLNTEHIELAGQSLGWLEWKARAGLFHWRNIPAKVTFESRRLGNSGPGNTVPGSSFFFAHEGWFAGTTLCYCARRAVDLVGEFSRVQNLRAPGNARDAQMWGVGPRFHWKNRELDLRYRGYFIESDATVAAYNKSRLGNTNRVGDIIEATLKFEDYHFSLYAEIYRAKPINEVDVDQRQMEQYYFGVETDYASF